MSLEIRKQWRPEQRQNWPDIIYHRFNYPGFTEVC